MERAACDPRGAHSPRPDAICRTAERGPGNSSFGREEISIRYVSSLEGKGDLSDYEALIAERLKLRVQAEIVAGHALIGPHRDDLEILLRRPRYPQIRLRRPTAKRSASAAACQSSPFFTPTRRISAVSSRRYRRRTRLRTHRPTARVSRRKNANFCHHLKGKFCRRISAQMPRVFKVENGAAKML